MDIFPDDYLNLADNDGVVINKSDSTLKVHMSLYMYIYNVYCVINFLYIYVYCPIGVSIVY